VAPDNSPFGVRRTHHQHVRVPKDAERELRFRGEFVAYALRRNGD